MFALEVEPLIENEEESALTLEKELKVINPILVNLNMIEESIQSIKDQC